MKQTTLIVSMLLVVSLARAEWELLLDTQTTSSVSVLETDGHRLFAGIGRGLYTSDDNGDTWCTTALTPGYLDAIAVSGATIYAFLYRQGMYRSDDYGETWNRKHRGIPELDGGSGEMPSVEQILVTGSGIIIAVDDFVGTYVSRDRGETWHFPTEWQYPCPKAPELDYPISRDFTLMAEYDGYWWAGTWMDDLYRSPDNGATWECLGHKTLRAVGTPNGSIVIDDQLYFGGSQGTHGFARWNEAELAFEPLGGGLPRGQPMTSHETPYVTCLAVNRGRIFAGLSAGRSGGVYTFDQEAETWIPVGLNNVSISSLISHRSHLYAGTSEGIYRASIPFVHSYGKAAATWGAIKTK